MRRRRGRARGGRAAAAAGGGAAAGARWGAEEEEEEGVGAGGAAAASARREAGAARGEGTSRVRGSGLTDGGAEGEAAAGVDQAGEADVVACGATEPARPGSVRTAHSKAEPDERKERERVGRTRSASLRPRQRRVAVAQLVVLRRYRRHGPAEPLGDLLEPEVLPPHVDQALVVVPRPGEVERPGARRRRPARERRRRRRGLRLRLRRCGHRGRRGRRRGGVHERLRSRVRAPELARDVARRVALCGELDGALVELVRRVRPAPEAREARGGDVVEVWSGC